MDPHVMDPSASPSNANCPWPQVSAYTNGRSEVTVQDCLLLQHLMWQSPNEAERISEWLLAQLAEGGDVRQCDYLLNSKFHLQHRAVDLSFLN